jgi:cobalamin biosynthesis protein CobD/CbiB
MYWHSLVCRAVVCHVIETIALGLRDNLFSPLFCEGKMNVFIILVWEGFMSA